MTQWSNKCVARSRLLMTLVCVLLSLTPANGAPQALSLSGAKEPLLVVATPKTASTVSPPRSCPPDSDVEQPNAVRRFFSWVVRGITRPFRRRPRFACYLPPSVSISASPSTITLPCPGTTTVKPLSNCTASSEVTLLAVSNAPENEVLFTWSVTGGVIRGEGQKVTWDLSGVPVGTYTVTVEMNDGNQLTVNASATITVSNCPDCETR
jgi:hypothetical protein